MLATPKVPRAVATCQFEIIIGCCEARDTKTTDSEDSVMGSNPGANNDFFSIVWIAAD